MTVAGFYAIMYNGSMRNLRLPEFFRSILWSYDFSRINPQRDIRVVVVQTINYGTWEHWRWSLKNYGKQRVKKLVENIPASEFRPEALALATAILGIKSMKYASRSAYIRAQKSLAAT